MRRGTRRGWPATGGMLASVLGVAVCGVCDRAEAQIPEGLQQAVAFYHANATSDLVQILEATRRFETITARTEDDDRTADGWLAPYWTALAYSQLVLFSGDERGKPYVQLAQHYYDAAWRSRPEGDASAEADLHALHALIKNFWATEYPQDARGHQAEQRRLWELAESTDPENPMVFMNHATSLLPSRTRRAEAYQHVERARELYAPRIGTVRPNWGVEWLEVWTGRYPRGR